MNTISLNDETVGICNKLIYLMIPAGGTARWLILGATGQLEAITNGRKVLLTWPVKMGGIGVLSDLPSQRHLL